MEHRSFTDHQRRVAVLLVDSGQRIESGEIGPREPLPSITYLAGETGLAVGTVRKAIAVLVDEGLAYTVPGRGTFAAGRKDQS